MPNLSKLGDVYFTEVENENFTYSNDITDKPMEDGTVVQDNVKSNPTEINISGILTGKTAYPQAELTQLRMYALNGTVVAYKGVQGFSKCIIESFENDHSCDVANGITFNMTLKVCKFATKQIVNINVGGLTIPDIEALEDQLSAQKTASKAAAKARVATSTNKTKKSKTVKSKNTENVLAKIKAINV